MFKKKATDMTVGDSLKYTLIITAISFVPVVIMLAWEKIIDGIKSIAGKISRKAGDR